MLRSDLVWCLVMAHRTEEDNPATAPELLAGPNCDPICRDGKSLGLLRYGIIATRVERVTAGKTSCRKPTSFEEAESVDGFISVFGTGGEKATLWGSGFRPCALIQPNKAQGKRFHCYSFRVPLNKCARCSSSWEASLRV